MDEQIKKKIEDDVLKELYRLKLPQLKLELNRLNVKGLSKLNAKKSLDTLKRELEKNTDEIINIYNSYKLELDMFQKDVLNVLNISKKEFGKLELIVTGIQELYIKTHHRYEKYDREHIYNMLFSKHK